MKRRPLILAVLLVVALVAGDRIAAHFFASPAVHVINGAVSRTVFGPRDLPPGFAQVGRDFDIRGDGTIVVQLGSDLVAVKQRTDGTAVFHRLLSVDGLKSFTGDGTGAILATTADSVIAVGGRQTHTLVPLSGSSGDARLARAQQDHKVYLYGDAYPRVLLSLSRGGQVQNLVQTLNPISGVAEAGGTICVATGREIYAYDGSSVRLIERLPKEEADITSVAVDERNGILYFATARRVYAMRGLAAVSVATGIGGTVHVRNGALYILDPRRRELMRLGGLAAL
jgi:hypothetical protein